MSLRSSCVAAAVILVQSGLALGGETRWVGGIGGVWDDPTSWSLGEIPTLSDDVIFEVGQYTKGVSVEVSRDSLFCSLHVESGHVVFNMGAGAAFVSLQGDSGCDARHPRVSIAGAGQVASLTLLGGVLTDGLDQDTVEIWVGSGESAVGKLVLAGQARAEPWTIHQSGSVIMLGDGLEAVGELVLDTSVDLRAFEIVGHDGGERTGTALIRVTRGFDVGVKSIDSVGRVQIGSDASLECRELFGGEMVVGAHGTVRCDVLSPDVLTLGEAAEIRTLELGPHWVEVSGSGGVISAGRVQRGVLLRLDISDLGVESEPLLMLSDLSDAGRTGVDIVVSSGAYPEIGSVLALAGYFDFFDGRERRVGVGDPARFSFELYSRQFSEQSERSYFIVNDEVGASLLVGSAWMERWDLNFDGAVDFFDVSAFIDFYLRGSPWANIDGVNGVGVDDIFAFLKGFN